MEFVKYIIEILAKPFWGAIHLNTNKILENSQVDLKKSEPPEPPKPPKPPKPPVPPTPRPKSPTSLDDNL